MKRSFISLALFAALACAHADTVYSWSWTEEGAAASNSTLSGSSFSYTAGNNYATIGDSNSPWLDNITTLTGSFTFSFSVKNLSANLANYQPLLTLYSTSGSAGFNNSMFLMFSAGSGELVLQTKPGGTANNGNAFDGGSSNKTISSGITSASLNGSTQWTDFSIVSDKENNKLTMYVNGNAVGSVTDWGTTDAYLGLHQFRFGTGYSGSSSSSGGTLSTATIDINNIAIANTAVYPASEPVPEPATATLSLLALAGLAARRRRK